MIRCAVPRVFAYSSQGALGGSEIIKLNSTSNQGQRIVHRIWIRLHGFPSPIQRGAFSNPLGQLGHDPGSRRAVRLHVQNAARSQAGVTFVSPLDVTGRPPDQPFLLPSEIEIVSAPDCGDQENDAEQNAERKSNDCSLCSFDRFFQSS